MPVQQSVRRRMEGANRVGSTTPGEIVTVHLIDTVNREATSGGSVGDAAAVPAQPHNFASMRFEARPTSGAQARRFITQVCADLAITGLVDDAQLVVTELVENAVRHGPTAGEVTVERTEHGLRIGVRDGSQSLPRRVLRTPAQPSGRGLLLVERLSRSWGVEVDRRGKTVWAVLELPHQDNAVDGAHQTDTDAKDEEETG